MNAEAATAAGRPVAAVTWWRNRWQGVVQVVAVVVQVVLAFARCRLPSGANAGFRGSYGRWSWSHLAYSDEVQLWWTHHLGDHALPYVHTTIEYPVLTGLFMWTAAWVPGIRGYFLVSSAAMLVCALVSWWVLSRLSPKAGWVFALSPFLLLYAVFNWDLLAIALMLAGWWQFRRRRFSVAGVVLALAVWAKFFPVVLLVYGAVELLTRHKRDLRSLRAMALGATVTSVVVNVPFVVANPRSWGDFFSFNATRTDTSGLLFMSGVAQHWPVAAVDAVSLLVVLAVMAWLAWRVLCGATAEFAAAVTFAVLMVMNKVFSPQYMLWVLVFALLAGWPAWSVATLTVAGLADFADASITLHMVMGRSDEFPWWYHNVFDWNKVLRAASVLAGAGFTVVGEIGRARSPALGTGDRGEGAAGEQPQREAAASDQGPCRQAELAATGAGPATGAFADRAR